MFFVISASSPHGSCLNILCMAVVFSMSFPVCELHRLSAGLVVSGAGSWTEWACYLCDWYQNKSLRYSCSWSEYHIIFLNVLDHQHTWLFCNYRSWVLIFLDWNLSGSVGNHVLGKFVSKFSVRDYYLLFCTTYVRLWTKCHCCAIPIRYHFWGTWCMGHLHCHNVSWFSCWPTVRISLCFQWTRLLKIVFEVCFHGAVDDASLIWFSNTWSKKRCFI